MKNLLSLLNGINFQLLQGSLETKISSIQYDSRKCEENSLFVAITGEQFDGHIFIESAIEKGANTILCEKTDFEFNNNTTIIKVENSRQALAHLSHNWFGNPTKDMYVVGITGTNGKTTTTFLLKSIFEEAGFKCGIIGTTGIIIGDEFIPATHTTPESLELASIFNQMKDKSVNFVAMEVSSHALHQHRADCIDFDAALFSNLTLDHLDYHKTMKDYANAKKILFDSMKSDSIAISIFNESWTDYLLKDCKSGTKFIVSEKSDNDICIQNITLNSNGSEFSLKATEKEIKIKSPLIGKFNIENLSLAVTLAYAKGIENEIIQEALLNATGAPGRMQKVILKNGAVGIVDYSHTPDALEKALLTCREILNSSNLEDRKLICVFGCGGDRDKSKRPKMGNIAATHSDIVIVTDDNPRTEISEEIIADIFQGISEVQMTKVNMISNRAKAIAYAVKIAQDGDIILVAGKGHENYQIIGKTKHHFDDVEELMKIQNSGVANDIVTFVCHFETK